MACCIRDCTSKVHYLCICQDKDSLMCQSHLDEHLKSPFNHEMIAIEENPDKKTEKILLEKLESNINYLSTIKEKIYSYKKKFEIMQKAINEAGFLIEDKIEQINELIKVLVNREEPKEYIRNNFWIYSCISHKKIERIVSDWSMPEVILPEIPRNIFVENKFCLFIERLVLPNLKTDLRMQYEIIADIDDKLSKDKKSNQQCKYMKGALNHLDIVLKSYQNSEDINKQIENHERLSKENSIMLTIISKFKKRDKIQIITEKWTHTLWNEIITRSYYKDHFQVNFIKNVFSVLLTFFSGIEDLLHITPNVLHKTTETWKIWYPRQMSIKEKLPYCSYEIGNDLPIRLNSFSNLYSIGLIILQMSLLIDTSRLYPRESEKKLKEELLKIEDENLRRTLIGVLLPANSRINYEKAIKILNGNI